MSNRSMPTPMKTIKTTYRKCHEDHPTLSFGKGELVGASCITPRKGFDIYIGFDTGMTKVDRWLPWLPALLRKTQEILFPIRDMNPPDPKTVPDFKKLVTWILAQLKRGKRIHMGCIGGHGRTGMVLAAVIKELTGEVDAIEWVRKNYCEKAVETQEQVNFLHKHYGIKKRPPSHGIHSASPALVYPTYPVGGHPYEVEGDDWIQ